MSRLDRHHRLVRVVARPGMRVLQPELDASERRALVAERRRQHEVPVLVVRDLVHPPLRSQPPQVLKGADRLVRLPFIWMRIDCGVLHLEIKNQ